MCILFVYNGDNDDKSDYRMILISNRDENYDRPTQNMALWSEDPIVIAGRDLQSKDDSTWLAVSPTYKKIGVLLNLPGDKKGNALSRGTIVADYIKINEPVQKYVESLKSYTNDCNGFVFVTVEFSAIPVEVYSYSNANCQLKSHSNAYIGFGNTLPNAPSKKTEVGKKILEEICSKYNKESMEKELVENLIALLKSEERHLPDKELEARQPQLYKKLSSIYVCIPEARYGTRTHTIVILTKKGHLRITELTQQAPINPTDPVWEKTEFDYNEIIPT